MFKLSSKYFNFNFLDSILSEIHKNGYVVGKLKDNKVITSFSDLDIINSNDISYLNENDTIAIVEKNGFFYGMSITEYEKIKKLKKAKILEQLKDEKYKKKIELEKSILNRKEAIEFNKKILLNVPWRPVHCMVDSGLNTSSMGDGTYSKSVVHIELLEPFVEGRLKRNSKDLLCNSDKNSKSKLKGYRVLAEAYSIDGNKYNQKVTCKACLNILRRKNLIKK
ncbi:TPA: hypothetical protein KQG29_001515 [Clostridioides difficile]|uniref:hypothetical protein n=1 Tax=Clostridioides sp. ZZV15-6597 TaxID=2811500 RepID=UPI001C1BEBAC|nr:hypothetical protein [Clostridioides sp. ZZV15-6597]HBG5344151.1 hypothetical protein [Clostridioides difficile]